MDREAADEALRAAAGLRVFDGRATAWLVAAAAARGRGVRDVLRRRALRQRPGRPVGVDRRGRGRHALRLGGSGGPPCRGRAAAVAHPLARHARDGGRGRHPGQRRAARPLAGLVGQASGFVVGAAALAACYLVAPRSCAGCGRVAGPRGATAWPDGAQAYAVLAVLSRAQWVHPDRLAVLTGLPRDRCDEWLRACAARGLATTAARRAFLMRNCRDHRRRPGPAGPVEPSASGRVGCRPARVHDAPSALPTRRRPSTSLSRAPTPRRRPART